MHKLTLIAGCWLAVLIGGPSAVRADSSPQFQFGDLPSPEPTKPVLSLFDVFATGAVSPLGASAASVKPEDLFDEASNFLRGSAGHQNNPAEAAFWLKRAIALAPDDTGQRRAWALMRLGILVYTGGTSSGHAAARSIWELAGAWNNPDALCNLGELAEHGDDVMKPDPERARFWYERAKKAGCAKADDALARLKP